ncbi:MAG: glycosyltransferase family 2 protein [Ilumatobacteraceae bacterium]
MSRDATYVVPIRSPAQHPAELTTYLRWVAGRMPLVIIDGSPPEVFDAVHDVWSQWAVHARPDSRIVGANGKVRGVLSSVAHVQTPFVVIADDDVRYTAQSLHACVTGLHGVDLIAPQNFFGPMPWHAGWDTARTLLNRSVGHDLPGTLGVRTAHLAGGYDADVLFENLELIRTVAARGGTCVWRPDIYVRRLPPTVSHFWSQRVRHAYDEFARPQRMVLWLSLLPLAAVALANDRPEAIMVVFVAAMVAAEIGRRRHGGREWFAAGAVLATPIWLVERSVCAWLAVIERLRGGVPYAGTRLARAATPERLLAIRHRHPSRPRVTYREVAP